MSAAHPVGRLRIAIVIALMASLALGSFWLREVLNREEPDASTQVDNGEPDYTVENFNFVRLSEKGEVRYNVFGASLKHYQNDVAEIDKPVVHASSPQALPFTIRAERAVVSDRSKKIQLHQHVQLDRPASGKVDALRIRSDYMLVLPDEDIVRTDKAVDIQSGRTHVSGVGMIANNATREIHLARHVQMTLPPRPADATP